ncbi:hypothetical protein D9M69_696960 [compost metagenome]
MGATHADPVRPRQIGRRADAGAVDVTEEQIAVDLEGQLVAEKVEDGEHLVARHGKHLVVAPLEILTGAGQLQAESGDFLLFHGRRALLRVLQLS